MTINTVIKSKCKSKKLVNVRFRLVDGRNSDLWVKSNIKVDINFWDYENECYKSTRGCPYTLMEQKNVKDLIILRKMMIEEVYLRLNNGKDLSSRYFNEYVQRYIQTGSIEVVNKELLTVQFQQYIKDRRFGKNKVRTLTTLINSIRRYERYLSQINKTDYQTVLTNVNRDWLKDFMSFFENEPMMIDMYPELYNDKKVVNSFGLRSPNYLIEIMGYIKRFWNWLLEEGLVNYNPFITFKIGKPVYGKPIVMTKNEISKLYNFTFEDEQLEKVKSIFLFQLFIGSRFGELQKMTKSTNLIDVIEDGVKMKVLEYSQSKTSKTSGSRPFTPLNGVALEMLNKYYFTTDKVIPKISDGNFNKNLKKVFKIVGLDRMVLVNNKETGEEERKPLFEIASSQLARRTFLSLAVNSGVDKSVYTSITGHRINTPHLERYVVVETKTKKMVLDDLCRSIVEYTEPTKFVS